MRPSQSSVLRVVARALAVAFALAAIASPASAQLLRASPTQVIRMGDLAFGSDTAYDPVNDVYLVVIAKEAPDRALSTLVGVFVSPTGAALSSVIIHTGNVNLPRVVHVSNMGVTDAFLVTWADYPTNSIRARTLRYPGVLGGPYVSLGGGYGVQEVAYSPTSRIAATVWTSDAAPTTTWFSRLLMPFATASNVAPLTSGTSVRSFPLWNSLVDIAWNPTRNEFAVLYVSDTTPKALRFRRVSTAGVALDDRTVATTTVGPVAAQMAFSPLTGHYVAYWADGVSGRITGAELSADGAILATGELPPSIVGGLLGMSLAYNPVSGTFLLIGFSQISVAHEQIRGLELNKFGAPQGSPVEVTNAPLSGNFYAPRAVGRGAAPEWLIESETAGGTHYAQIVSTFTTGGGSELRLHGCTGSDPFAALGGGICVAGGWQPNTTGTPPPPPPPAPTDGCTTPDPFVFLGGGTCQNGGWLPPTTPVPPPSEPQAPPPPPPPVGGTCATPDPFISLGGGTCVNGGWLPPGVSTPTTPPSPPPPPPPPPSGNCTVADPFAALGGGTCYNGGWLPPGMAAPNSGSGSTPPPPTPPPPPPPAPVGCPPDPFAAIPTLIGECRNGGWVPIAVEIFTGVIARSPFGNGNVWSVQTAGTTYEFINAIPSEFQVEGLAVTVKAARETDIVSVWPKIRWYIIALR